MIRKFVAALAVSLLAVVGLLATPAQASTVYGCQDYALCIYRWTQFNQAGGMYSFTAAQFHNAPNNCIDFAGYPYANDQSVADNSGSVIANRLGAGSDYVVLFDWPNCNGNGRVFNIAASLNPTYLNHLSQIPGSYFPVAWWDAYHQVHSARTYGI